MFETTIHHSRQHAMKTEKILGALNERLSRSAGAGAVEAIIQVTVPASTETLKRERKIPEYRQAVEEALRPVAILVRDLGGDVLDEAWINATLRVKLPVESFGPLTDDAAVTRVDLPSRLKPESGR